MLELSNYIAGAIRKKLSEEVTERVTFHLIDTFAAMISGSRLPSGKQAIKFIKSLKGAREAGIVGRRVTTSTLYAALANGMAAHGDETDDTHPPSRTHPGSSVVPAILAIGERDKLSGILALRAMALGYDVCARTLLSLMPRAGKEANYYNGAFGQLFGAATASSALLRLDAQKVRYVLSYAAQQASGLETRKRDTQHIEKAYVVAGMTAHHGVLSALMVKSGFTGVSDIYAGEPNFFSIFSPNTDREALVRGLGKDFEIMRGGIKRWPAGGPIQAPLHVLHEILQEHKINSKEVSELTVHIPERDLHSVNNRAMTDISLQHLLAVTLLDGALTFSTAHDHRRAKDPKVLEILPCIKAVGDPHLSGAIRGWRCSMEIKLNSGRIIKGQTMAAKGSFENPLTRQDVIEKALDLISPILGTGRAKKLIEVLLNLSATHDLRNLRSLYSS